MFYCNYGSISCCFWILRYSMSKNVMTLKLGSEVTQGHWKWYHSIDCISVLEISTWKTKVMVTSEGRDHTFTCNGEALEQVESFHYLGAVITSTGDCSVEIHSRLGIARSALTCMNNPVGKTMHWIKKNDSHLFWWSRRALSRCKVWERYKYLVLEANKPNSPVL